MKKIFLIAVLIAVSMYGQNTPKNKKEKLADQQMKIQMQKEQKYAEEQTFYQMDNYDFQGAEVNPESLDSVPELELDDLDMDSVYD